MNDFDEQLRDEFGRRAPRGVSVRAAHEAVLDRSGRIRRRRAIVGSGALLALVVGGLVLVPRGGGDSQAPADSGQPIPSVEDEAATDDLATSTSISDRGVVTDDDEHAPPSTGSSVPTTSTDVGTQGAPRPTTDGRSGTTQVGSSPASTASAPSPTTSSPATTNTTATTASSTSLPSSTTGPSVAPFTRSYDSAGGSITVDWDGDSFTLLSIAPAAGFETEIEDQRATRIRVRFRSDDDDSRIEVRVDNGTLSVDIS